LALLVLTDARRGSRTDDAGEPVGLDAQDRTGWDAALLGEGVAVLDRAMRLGRPGPYQLQAAVAAVHSDAPSVSETDWAQIAALYGTLEQIDPSPVVTINRAVAVAHVDGPHAGSNCSRRSNTTTASPATSPCTPAGRSCSTVRATSTGPGRPIGGRLR
jgi:RNA polymerase sigma-70 factor, ECF subfamily